MAQKYPFPVKKFLFYDPIKDVTKLTVRGNLKHGCLLGKVSANGNIVAYNPLENDGSNTAIGVLLHVDAESGDLADVALRGKFGDNYVFVDMNEVAEGDGTEDTFELLRPALYPEASVVTVGGVTQEYGVDYTIETEEGTTNLIFAAESIPENLAAIAIWYKGKFTSDDFWNCAPELIVETVIGYPA